MQSIEALKVWIAEVERYFVDFKQDLDYRVERVVEVTVWGRDWGGVGSFVEKEEWLI